MQLAGLEFPPSFSELNKISLKYPIANEGKLNKACSLRDQSRFYLCDPNLVPINPCQSPLLTVFN
jgi:hypothetical protein